MVFIMAVAYFFYLLSPVSESADLKIFSIPPGTGVSEIAEQLYAQGVIRSAGAFKFYGFLSGSAHRLKPGSYSLAKNMSIKKIVEMLVLGPPDIEVLITEGKSLKDIDLHLAQMGLIKVGELANFSFKGLTVEFPFLRDVSTMEGFLFPDTYKISPGSPPEIIIKRFLNNFREKASLAFGDAISKNGSNGWYENLIIASLIEKEVPAGDERKLVAGILEKRLALGMPLQVDATVVYVKCSGRYDNCPPLTKSDFKIKSNYNTYYQKGLPPAPIANPGLDALVAAVDPKKSDFLYYLSDPGTQKTIFSKTLEEHNLNRSRYLHL